MSGGTKYPAVPIADLKAEDYFLIGTAYIERLDVSDDLTPEASALLAVHCTCGVSCDLETWARERGMRIEYRDFDVCSHCGQVIEI